MAILLKQSTASQEVPLGTFLDSTDGNTQETALSIANTDIKIWKAGATTLANKTSGGATHIANGVYYAVLDATDTDTLGSLQITVHVTGALIVKLECLVVTAAAYDFMTAVTGDAYARLGVPAGASVSVDIAAVKTQTAAIEADTQDLQARTPAALVAGRIDASVGAMATDVLTSTALNTNAVTEIQSGLATAASITALNNLSAAQVNAEMLDVLVTDTFAEVTTIPAATSSLKDKINWLFALARNKLTQTSTTFVLRNDADSADIATATCSDDGTTTIRGEFV